MAAVLVAGTLVGTAGCASGSNYTCCRRGRPTPVVQATLGPDGHPPAVRLRRGQILEVRATGSQEVSITPAGVVRALNPGPGILEFRALRRGQATVTVQAANCPAQAVRCSGVLRVRAVVVTVY